MIDKNSFDKNRHIKKKILMIYSLIDINNLYKKTIFKKNI